MSQACLLRLKAALPVGVDASGLLPERLTSLSIDEIARLPMEVGREEFALGELFDISLRESDAVELRLEGDCRKLHGLGRGMAAGRLVVDGPVGDQVGAEMRGGEILVCGDAGDLAAGAMAGGRLEVGGSVGDFAASTLPGAMDGMRGGVLIVRGNAGDRFGDRMRRGVAVVHGRTGDFLASRMVAGTIALAGDTGAHPGHGMRRGTLVFAGAQPRVPDTFAATHHDTRVFWALLTRSLAPFGAPFDGLAGRCPARVVGDLGAEGKGEWLLPA